MPEFMVAVEASVYVEAANEFEARRVVQANWATHRAEGVSSVGKWKAEGTKAFASSVREMAIALPADPPPVRIAPPPPSRRPAADLELY